MICIFAATLVINLTDRVLHSCPRNHINDDIVTYMSPQQDHSRLLIAGWETQIHEYKSNSKTAQG